LADFDPVRSLQGGDNVMLVSRFVPGCVATPIAVVTLITLSPNIADSGTAPRYELKDYVENAEWKILDERVSLDK
jgi:NADH:ubiquinone oxidoreductase subunit B-like Fe-S oxidoreductase